MNLKDIRNKAKELYKRGEKIEKISKKIGIDISSEMIEKWIKEDECESSRAELFRLDRKRRKEKDENKRKEILVEMKKKLKEILKILPDDIEMQTMLMYVYISLKDIEEARKMGDKLLEKTDAENVLNGITIIEEMSGNYDKAIRDYR